MDKEFINNPVEAYTRLNSLYNDNCEYTKKLEDTLQEIKAIAEKTIDIYYPDYYDEGFEEDIVTEFAKQVLDLITKAEEE